MLFSLGIYLLIGIALGIFIKETGTKEVKDILSEEDHMPMSDNMIVGTILVLTTLFWPIMLIMMLYENVKGT